MYYLFLFIFQQLFVATEAPDDLPPEHNIAAPTDANGTCVVCQQSGITHVVLPCRHACSCSLCFSQLTKCPMCRGPIDSYLCMGRSEEREVEETDLQLRHRPSLMTRIQHLNDRVNDWMGFT